MSTQFIVKIFLYTMFQIRDYLKVFENLGYKIYFVLKEIANCKYHFSQKIMLFITMLSN